MQNNTSKLNTILLIMVIILLAVGIWAILSQKKNSNVENYDFPTQADLKLKDDTFVQPNIPSKTPQQTDLTPTQSTSNNELKTYSNSNNGFSFKYPSDWVISENPLNNSVKISTKSSSVIGVDDVGRPIAYSLDYSIMFTKTDKTFFNQPNRPIQTKYGEITYDQNRNSILIDGQCRPAEGIEGSSLQGVRYGGSLMSDPAYGDSAIVTTNKNVIIVHTEMGVTPSDATRAQIKSILDSFSLINGNNVFIPVCN